MRINAFTTMMVLTIALSCGYASDSCQAVLCLAGKLQSNSGGTACDASIATYFAIKRFTNEGNFDAALTSAARLHYLQGCPTAQPEWIERINDAFGGVE